MSSFQTAKWIQNSNMLHAMTFFGCLVSNCFWNSCFLLPCLVLLYCMELIALQFGNCEGQDINCTINPPAGLPKPGQESAIISNAITILLIVGVLAALITVVWSGVEWTMSGGDKQKLAAAKARITWGIIGLVIIMFSFFIINLWGYFFGVNLLNVSL